MYAFVNNDPVNGVDYLGMYEKKGMSWWDSINLLCSLKYFANATQDVSDIAAANGWAGAAGTFQFIADASGMLYDASDTSTQLTSLLDSYEAREKHGMGSYYSSMMTVGERMPIMNMMVKGTEMYDGRAYDAHGVGNSLTSTDYWSKGLTLGGESVLWSVGAYSHYKSGARPASTVYETYDPWCDWGYTRMCDVNQGISGSSAAYWRSAYVALEGETSILAGKASSSLKVNSQKRVGSAAWKSFDAADANHYFSNIVDNYAGKGKVFLIDTKGPGGVIERQSTLYQVMGSLNGKTGIFEWIIDTKAGGVSHRRFIPRGKFTGYPNQIPPQ